MVGKRFADWLEKFSVLAAGVGVFQGKPIGILVAAIAFSASVWLTKRLGG